MIGEECGGFDGMMMAVANDDDAIAEKEEAVTSMHDRVCWASMV